MKEMEFLDILPYCLLVVLPIFIAISPMNPVEAAHEFPVHRLAHYELGSGQVFGSKIASLALDARAIGASNVLRKIVVVKLQDISVAGFNEIVSSGAAGLLLVVPPNSSTLSERARESILALEEYFIGSEIEIPVYFATESQELTELLVELREGTSKSTVDKGTAAQALYNNIASSGYQLVTSVNNPKAIPDSNIVTIHGSLFGRGHVDSLPTIVVVAHYDTSGAAPGLSKGADSNGSGVAMLFELSRLWNKLYSNSRTHPGYNLVFLLSGGGKVNYFGTKRWLEEHTDNDQNSEILSNVAFILCLDAVSGNGTELNFHVSKPPKPNTEIGRFFENFKMLAAAAPEESKISVGLVHKKINLADENLSWEHERFSIRRIPALTLSRFRSHLDPLRATILDTEVSAEIVTRNTRLVAEALACTVYNNNRCTGQIFGFSLKPSDKAIQSWLDFLTSHARASSVLSHTGKTMNPVVQTLGDSLKTNVHDLKTLISKREKREPEFVFYDVSSTTMYAYKVKPAVFDLVLTMAIAGYLSVIYLVLIKAGVIFSFFKAALIGNTATSQFKKKSETNGNHHKVK